jgi:hypothetical protein
MTRFTSSRIARIIAVLGAVAMLAAACSDESGSDPEAGATTVPESTTSTSTTLPGTTAPIPETGQALSDLELTLVEFGADGFVEFRNNGADDIDLAGVMISSFPDYADLGTIVDGGTIAAGATARVPAEHVGGLSVDSGEAALYAEANYGSAEAILSYVQWGHGDHTRSPVAVEAEIWPAADVFVTPDPTFNNIESGGDAADPELWG